MKFKEMNEKCWKACTESVGRAKSPGNSSCFVLRLDNNLLAVYHGKFVRIKQVCISFESGDSYFFYRYNDEHDPIYTTEFEKLSVYLDLNRNRFFLFLDEKLLETQYATILLSGYYSDCQADRIETGFYYNDGACTLLGDGDFRKIMGDLSYHLFQKDILSKDSEEDENVEQF